MILVNNSPEYIRMLDNGHNPQQLQEVLNRYCLSITGSTWDAEDLAQETWLKAISKCIDVGHSNPEALLLRIAKNTWIDHLRRKAYIARMLKQEESRVGLLDEGSFGIELAFQALVKHLSPLQRTVFLLRDVLSYSITETAELLETSEGAIKAALHRARQSLKAVKDDLEKGTLPAPKEEGLKSFLRALANAYRIGDLTTLIELAQRDEIEPVAAIGIVQHEIRARTAMMHSDFQSRSYWAVMMSA